MCPKCGKQAIKLTYEQETGEFICRYCLTGASSETSCRLFEYGHENPIDPKGSTAHVRDIKARRYDFKEKRLVYAESPKTYFFKKG